MRSKSLEIAGGPVAAALPKVLEAVQGGRIGRLVLVRHALRLVAPAQGAATSASLAAGGRHAAAVLAALSGPPPTWAFGLRRTIGPATAPSYLVGHFQLADGAFATVEAHVAPAGGSFKPWEDLVVVGSQGLVRAGTDWDGRVLLHDRNGQSVLCRVEAGPLALTASADEAAWPRFPGVSRSVVAGVLAQLAEADAKARNVRHGDGR